ncbi:alpha/beta hydrolase [Paenibacillus sp. FSL H8-0548]|uniref:alpha/beta hydrolase n=1 Tax=Paenibacillus sp. FSL H8-0548 TaxID=1920422 RepID=UPI00096C5889|nr:alpha/beta hydrolase [Paenibacillus sp. FSL H8-0548]OMF37125.1 alpha/beta hydrolase [Paenibacillus sp. FSL H8-0548]
MKLPFVITGGLVFVLLGILIALSYYFYNVAIKRNSKAFLSDNSDLAEISSKDEDEPTTVKVTNDVQPTPVETTGITWVESHVYDTWQLTTDDGLALVGYYLAAHVPTTKTVILAHGYSSQGKDMGSFAQFYYEELGYNVLMPDDRGHGRSEGNYIGFGWADRKDYLLWIHKVIEVIGDSAQIVLHGISMGGATVMMVSGEDVPKQVKAIVEDCGYTSVYDQLRYQLKRIYKLPAFPIMQTTSLLTWIKAGYHFQEASALKQLEKNKLPTLFIHGSDDSFVPTEMVWRLYEACKADKEIFIVDGAGHGMAYLVDKTSYEQKVTAFIGHYVQA